MIKSPRQVPFNQNKMKKLTLFLFIIIATLTFTACTGEDSGLLDTDMGTVETTSTTDSTKLNFDEIEISTTEIPSDTKSENIGSDATDSTKIESNALDSLTEEPVKIEPINETTMRTTPEKGDTIATIKTNKGVIKMLLYTNQAPETTKNFIELAKAKKYDGVIFHRVINDFMIQTGDFENQNGTGGYTYQGPGTLIKDEFGPGLKHLRGAVSMANAGPNTGGSQFFIVQKSDGTDWLNGKHSIFGFVYEGMDVVDAIAAVEADAGNKPLSDIKMEDVAISVF